MKYFVPLLVVVSLFLGCQNSTRIDKIESPEGTTTVESKAPSAFSSSEHIATLNTKHSSLNLDNAKNIGEFFDHRLKFFKIQQPKIKIHETPVEELVLYFIDSTLVKMRYQVNEEVGSFLLDSLGLSKFKPLDSISKELLKKKAVYNRITSRLNPELKNYELIWRNDHSVKRYRVKTFKDSTVNRYYYHELLGYKKKVKELEVMYYYMENAVPTPLLD